MAHGRYTILGKLADGGMAEIFLAMQHGAEGFQKPVVLKRVLTAFSADPQFRNMFLDEAHICMTLNHGNIVQVLDVGVAGERTFLVMELVEGWDLEQVMERAQASGPDHPWPPSLALYVTAQICRALAYAHAKRGPDGRPLGIVHRDVSPTNVLISEQGEVKLADFGIAKAESKREQTLAGVIKGKIGFMSPEQALGRPLDARADLFSVGTVMYLMLTGRRPFLAGSELESMMLAQRAEYRPPEELNPYLSPEATAIVTRAMQRAPSDRYQTADDMLVDVERVLRGHYHSAGQTELKLWLAELGRRDGVLPMGRRPAEDSARPVFVDESGDLSAGSSLELSDFDGSAAAAAAAAVTAVAFSAAPVGVTPPPQTAAGSLKAATPASRRHTSDAFARAATPATPPPVAVGTTPPPASRSQSLAAVAAQPPARGDVSQATAAASVTRPPTPARLPKRSRVGLGFLLGALCMLGAVFGIRALAQWAGRERIQITRSDPDRGHAAAGSSTPPAAPAVAPGAAPAAGVKAPTAVEGGTVDQPAGPPGAVAAAKPDPAAPAAPADAGITAAPVGVAATAAATAADRTPAGQPPAASPAAADEDETRLVGRIVRDAAAVVGEDEAEEEQRAGKAAGIAKSSSQSASATGRAMEEQGDSRRATRIPAAEKPISSRNAAAAIARTQPVQIRITTSPLGAVVRTKKQVLGRTPVAVRFKPGNTYELTFVKSGYVTNRRRLSVVAGKPQSISVALKKSAPIRRSFFRGR